jgi:hypothetical protein
VSLGFYKEKIGLRHKLKSGASPPLTSPSFLFFLAGQMGTNWVSFFSCLQKKFWVLPPKERKVVSSYICFAFLLTENFISLKIAAAE